ncbi:MAG: precorrin-6y C5,15-methyltransferase (decarboxylating) subunit CbiE, partial [Acidimicrobiales bacterium]
MPERIVVIGLTGPRLLPEALAQARLTLGSERHFAILELCPNFHGCLPSGDGVPGDRVPGDGVPGDGSRSDSVPARAVLGSGGLSLAQGLDRIAAEPDTVAVLASGDPGFFGIVRPLADRFGSDRLDIHPAPSSVSLAFAMLGLAWDDALVVSAHGRPLDQAVAAACGGSKVAVLTSP